MSYKIDTNTVMPVVIPDATEIQDGVMTANQVQRLDGVAPNNPAVAVNIFMSPTGNNANDGSTSLSPVQTLARVLELIPLGWRKSVTINAAAGTYPDLNLVGNTYSFGVPTGNVATVNTATLTILGAFNNLYGTLTTTGADANGRTITDATLPVRSGATASIIAGAPAGQMRISGLTGYSSTDLNRWIKISGAASTGNNGKFLIVNVVSATSVDVVNAQATIPDGNNGAISWVESLFLSNVRMTSGASNGSKARIRDNSTTAINLNTGIGSVGIGDKFVIEKEGAVFPFSSALAWNATIPMSLVGIEFRATTVNSVFSAEGPVNLLCDGVAFNLGGPTFPGVFSPRLCAVRGQSLDATFSSRGFAAYNGNFQIGGGWGRLTQWSSYGHVNFNGQMAQCGFLDMNTERTTFTFSQGAEPRIDASSSAYPGVMNGSLGAADYVVSLANASDLSRCRRVTVTGGGGGFSLDQNSSATFETNVIVQNTGADAVKLNGRSYAKMGSMSGAGNAGVGCNLVAGGMSQVSKGTATVTGSGGDTTLGALVGLTWATYPLSEPSVTGPTLNRIDN